MSHGEYNEQHKIGVYIKNWHYFSLTLHWKSKNKNEDEFQKQPNESQIKVIDQTWWWWMMTTKVQDIFPDFKLELYLE